jgi:hypothetical protein
MILPSEGTRTEASDNLDEAADSGDCWNSASKAGRVFSRTKRRRGPEPGTDVKNFSTALKYFRKNAQKYFRDFDIFRKKCAKIFSRLWLKISLLLKSW